MSRHIEILRKAQLDGELFARTVSAGSNGSAAAAAPCAAPPRQWGDGGRRDQWQHLAHELFLRRSPATDRAIGLASATAGEGTSHVASHVAAELARATGRPTLLLEANLYRPSLAERLAVEPDPGLRHLLLDRTFPLEACVRPSGTDWLSLLPAGSPPEGFGGTPDWGRLAEIFDALRAQFGGIVADLPPVNQSSDSVLIGPWLDGVALVVEADLCSREVIQNAASRLQRANPNLLGTILNKRKFFVPAPIYRRL